MICVECGNDLATEGWTVCTDCLAELVEVTGDEKKIEYLFKERGTDEG